MRLENAEHPVKWIIAALAGLKYFFIVTSEGVTFLIGSEDHFIDKEEVVGLINSSSLGIYEYPIIEMWQADPPKSSQRDGWAGHLLNPDERIWRHVLDKHNLAIQLANDLAKKYGVNVAILETKDEYSSDETIQKTISDQIYFIAQDDPAGTYKATEILIKYTKLRDKTLLKVANTKRFEKADQIASQLTDKINEIKQSYRDVNQGKEPPLNKIAEILTTNQVESPNGSTKWFAQTVKRILERSQTEKY